MKFVADGMLGSVARKLRLYGMDVVYAPDFEDARLLSGAISEGRILLTSDNDLHAQALRHGARSILLTEGTDQDRLVSIFRSLGVKPSGIGPCSSRCTVCNGELVRASKLRIHEALPPSVSQRHSVFYKCTSCGKLFWEGSHWRRISLMSKYIRNKLSEENAERDLR